MNDNISPVLCALQNALGFGDLCNDDFNGYLKFHTPTYDFYLFHLEESIWLADSLGRAKQDAWPINDPDLLTKVEAGVRANLAEDKL